MSCKLTQHFYLRVGQPLHILRDILVTLQGYHDETIRFVVAYE